VLEPRDENKSDAVRLGPTPNPIDAALARGVHSLGQEGWQLYRLSALHLGSGAIGGAEEVVRDNEPHQLESIQTYDSICKGFFGSCVGKVRQALLIHPGSSWSTTDLGRGWKGRIRFVSIILLRSAVSLLCCRHVGVLLPVRHRLHSCAHNCSAIHRAGCSVLEAAVNIPSPLPGGRPADAVLDAHGAQPRVVDRKKIIAY